jgi:hypothetical protein
MIVLTTGLLGDGMTFVLARRNEPQWREVARFLVSEHVRAAGARAASGFAAARRAAVRTIPDGNHGDNRGSHR